MSKLCLLVIDVQPSYKQEPNYSKILKFIELNRHKFDKIIATEFLEKHNPPEKLEFEYDSLISKRTCGIGDKYCTYLLNSEYLVYVIGCDTDSCVLSTCFQLWDYGINFKVLTKYCYSTGGEEFHEAGIKVMRRNFAKNID